MTRESSTSPVASGFILAVTKLSNEQSRLTNLGNKTIKKKVIKFFKN